METGSAIAIVGTVFSIASSIAYAVAKSKSGNGEVGKKLDEISLSLNSIGVKVEAFTVKQAETGVRIQNIEENTQGEIKNLNQQLQEIYRWRLEHVESHSKSKVA